MDLDNKVKKYVKIDRETGSDKVFGLLDKVHSDLEDDIDNLRSDSDTEIDEPLHFFTPQANYHVAENANIRKKLEEGSRKDKKDLKGKRKEKA